MFSLTAPKMPTLDLQSIRPNDTSYGAELARSNAQIGYADAMARYNTEMERWQQGQREMTRRMGDIDRREADEIAGSNSAANAKLNSAALASARRQAGGGTFRRRGSATTANQLVSGLGASNAKALAEKRREIARREVESGIGWEDAYDSKFKRQQNQGFTIGAPIRIW